MRFFPIPTEAIIISVRLHRVIIGFATTCAFLFIFFAVRENTFLPDVPMGRNRNSFKGGGRRGVHTLSIQTIRPKNKNPVHTYRYKFNTFKNNKKIENKIYNNSNYNYIMLVIIITFIKSKRRFELAKLFTNVFRCYIDV